MNYAASPSLKRGELISFNQIHVISETAASSLLSLSGLVQQPICNETRLYRFKYYTLDPYDQYTIASGQIAIPVINAPLNILSYQHGTATHRYRVPSRLSYESGIINSAFFSAWGQFITIQPDYVGLGDSSFPIHPYLQPHSLANATVDGLFAAIKVINMLHQPGHTHLTALAGYSEGGLATLAALREIELNHHLSIYATAAGAGPYEFWPNIHAILNKPGLSSSLFTAYFLYSLQSIYQFWPSLESIFKLPYATLIPDLFNGQCDHEMIIGALPAHIKDLINQDFLEKLTQGHESNINLTAEQFRFSQWNPKGAIQLTGASLDNEVPFFNSENLFKSWSKLSKNIDLVNIGDYGHLDGKIATLKAQFKFLIDKQKS